MKAAILSYHKNVNKIYPKDWIEDYRLTILNQTKKDLPIFEMNYGGGEERLFSHSYFESVSMPTFVHALNYLLDKVFSGGFDCAGNTNVDDIYSLNWVEKSLPYIKKGYDIVSCNFHLFNEDGIYHTHHFDKLNIERELEKNHNVICHPGIFYSRKFWRNGNRYIPEEQPVEDRELWKRSIKNYNFIIIPEHLVYHRVHDNAVCRSNNR